MKLKYINNYKAVFLFYTYSIVSYMSRNVGLRGFEQYDSMREELLVLNIQAIYCLLLFFVGINFQKRK